MIAPDKFIQYMQQACADILQAGHVSDKPLRKTQREALEAYAAFLNRNDLADSDKLVGFFEIPTGVGKTVFFAALIAEARKYALKDGVDFRIGIVAPTISLLGQIKDDICDYYPELKKFIGLYGGIDRQLDKPITIITYDSWAALVDRQFLNISSFDLLISDEAHRGTSVKREERLISTFDGIGRIAVTATAHFDSEKTVLRTHKNKIFEKHIPESVEDNELASYIQVQSYVIRVNPYEEGGDAKRARQFSFNKFVEKTLLTGVDQRTGDPLIDNQGAIFVQDTTQADHLAELLNSNPKLQKIARERGCINFAVAIHTNRISDAEQIQRERDYKAGKYLFVIGDEKFKEGFNHPPMKTVIDSPHGSLVDKSQILGRGARQYFNKAKNRQEGLTFIDTIIYIGDVDPKIDEKRKNYAIANAVLAVDVLDGKAVVNSPEAPEPIVPRPIITPAKPDSKGEDSFGPEDLPGYIPGDPFFPFPAPHSDPFGSLSITSYVTLDGVRTLLAERERLREKEPIIDWTIPENRAEFDALRDRKGNPGALVLFHKYKALPQAERLDANGEEFFQSNSVIDNVLKGRLKILTVAQLNLLNQILNGTEDVSFIDWSLPENRIDLERLRLKKGGLGAKTIFKKYTALPQSRRLNLNGEEIFSSDAAIEYILAGRAKKITQLQLKLLTQILEMGDSIDWGKKENRAVFEVLHLKKGEPGYGILFRGYQALPKKERLDSNGEDIFSSADVINYIVLGRAKKITAAQLNVLTQILNKMDNEYITPTIDWSIPKNRLDFDALRLRKGNPGAMVLFNQYQELPKKLRINAKRGEIFSSRDKIDYILSGRAKTVAIHELNLLTQILNKMNDRVIDATIDWAIPKNRTEFEALRLRKGDPGYIVLFKEYQALPKTKRLNPNGEELFLSSDIMNYILAGRAKTITAAQLNVLTQILNKMDDKEIDPTIDWSVPKNRTEFETLRLEKGSPGAMILFRKYQSLPRKSRININGEELLSSRGMLDHVLAGKAKKITKHQLSLLMQILNAIEVVFTKTAKTIKQFKKQNHFFKPNKIRPARPKSAKTSKPSRPSGPKR